MAVTARARAELGDAFVALVLAGLAVVEIWVQPVFQTGLPGPRPVMTLLALLATVPLALRRRRPLVVGGTVLVALLAVGVVGDPAQAGFELFLALALATWSVATTVRGAAAGRAFAVLMVGAAVYESTTFVATDTAADLVVPVVLLVAVWTAGVEVRRLRDSARAAGDRAALVVDEQEARRERALQDERDRIARELHDVVASALSIVGVQAAAASQTVSPEDQRSQAAVATIERVSREAVLEMQRMLQVLRTGAEPDLLPGGVRVLTDLVRDSGLRVDLEETGELAVLPPGLQLTVLRIAQEALTNVRKHAGVQDCSVQLVVGASTVELVVTDGGRGPRDDAGAGHGLLGMAERARLVGGTLECGARSGGGFQVRARLPRDR